MADSALQDICADFYVYEIIVDGVVRYIGKGRGERHKEHLRTAKRILRIRSAGGTFRTSRFYNRLVRSIGLGQSIESKMVSIGLTETQALELEIAEIESRRKGLWNTFSGGIGFTSEWVRSRWADATYRATMCKRSKDNWTDPEFRQNQISVRNSSEHKAKTSVSLKLALSDPAVRQKMSQAKKNALADPELRQKFLSDTANRTSPEARAKSALGNRKRWSDPSYRQAMSEKHKTSRSTPQARKRLSEQAKAQMTPQMRENIRATQLALWADPIYRAAKIAAMAEGRVKKAKERSNDRSEENGALLPSRTESL
jgi:hypothetical protein